MEGDPNGDQKGGGREERKEGGKEGLNSNFVETGGRRNKGLFVL